jgi:hypothetical protein
MYGIYFGNSHCSLYHIYWCRPLSLQEVERGKQKVNDVHRLPLLLANSFPHLSISVVIAYTLKKKAGQNELVLSC